MKMKPDFEKKLKVKKELAKERALAIRKLVMYSGR
jgi:hypothetical protein